MTSSSRFGTNTCEWHTWNSKYRQLNIYIKVLLVLISKPSNRYFSNLRFVQTKSFFVQFGSLLTRNESSYAQVCSSFRECSNPRFKMLVIPLFPGFASLL